MQFWLLLQPSLGVMTHLRKTWGTSFCPQSLSKSPHDWRLGWSSPLKLRPCLLFQSRSPRNNNNFSILLSVTLQCHGIFNYLVNLSKVRPTLSRGIFVSVSAVTKEGAGHTGGQHSYQWCWDNVSSVGSIIQSGVRWWPNTSLYSITS